MKYSRWIAAGAAALLVAGVAGWAAWAYWGGKNKSTPVAASNQSYLTCLGQHGVTNLPSIGPRGNGSRSPGEGGPGNRPSGVRPSGVRPSGFGNGGFGNGGFGNQAPAGVDPTVFQKAQQACAPLRPSGRPQQSANPANLAYRNCLADHGVSASTRPDQLNTADPQVAEAMKVCQPLRPTGRPAASPSPTG